MIRLSHFFLLALLTLIGLYWWSAIAAREVAQRAARRHCDEHGLQFLDGCVTLRRIWVRRDGRGRICLWRSYQFEFSATGGERYQGSVATLADRVEGIHLPPHRSVPGADPQEHRTLH